MRADADNRTHDLTRDQRMRRNRLRKASLASGPLSLKALLEYDALREHQMGKERSMFICAVPILWRADSRNGRWADLLPALVAAGSPGEKVEKPAESVHTA